MSFLDATGLGTFWNKLKSTFQGPVSEVYKDALTPVNIMSDSYFTGAYSGAVIERSNILSGTWTSPTHNTEKIIKSAWRRGKVSLDNTGDTADDIGFVFGVSISPASGSAVTMSFTKTHSYTNYSIRMYSYIRYDDSEYVTFAAKVTVNNANIVPDIISQGTSQELFKNTELIKSENGEYTYKLVIVYSKSITYPTIAFDVKNVNINTNVVLKIDRMGVFKGGFKDPSISTLDQNSPFVLYNYLNNMAYSHSNLNLRPGFAIARNASAIDTTAYSKVVIPLATIQFQNNNGGYSDFIYAFSSPGYQGGRNTSKIINKCYRIKLGWISTASNLTFRKKEITEEYSDVASGLSCTADIRVNGSYLELVLSGTLSSDTSMGYNSYGVILASTTAMIKFLNWSSAYGEN